MRRSLRRTLVRSGVLLIEVANFVVDIDSKPLSPKIIIVKVLFAIGLALVLVGDFWPTICKVKRFIVLLFKNYADCEDYATART